MFGISQGFRSKDARPVIVSSQQGRESRRVARIKPERFSEKAIEVLKLAEGESRRLGHNYIGSEQILLGLIAEGISIPAQVLKSMGIDLEDARVQVEKIIGRGWGITAAEIPFTPRAKRILEHSLEEARELGRCIGPEHLLLGLLHES